MVEEIRTKDINCFKTTGGEGEMISCEYNKKASEVHLHPSNIIMQDIGECDNLSTGTKKCKLKSLKKFKIGDKWSSDFDYCGMLKAGKRLKISDGVKRMDKIFDSFEDVNHHFESEPLIESIESLRKNKKELAELKLKEFHKRVSKSIKEIC